MLARYNIISQQKLTSLSKPKTQIHSQVNHKIIFKINRTRTVTVTLILQLETDGERRGKLATIMKLSDFPNNRDTHKNEWYEREDNKQEKQNIVNIMELVQIGSFGNGLMKKRIEVKGVFIGKGRSQGRLVGATAPSYS